MLDSFTNLIIESFIKRNIIDKKERDLYSYGLKEGIILLTNILTAALVGILYGMLWQALLYLIVYIPLRSYAGGYHASTQLKCYLLSTLLIMGVLLGIRYIHWNYFITLGLTLVSGILIFLLAPVEDNNKKLDEIEFLVYRKRARLIYIFELSLLLLVILMKLNQAAACIAVSHLTLAIMLIIGHIKNLTHYEK